MTSTTDQNTLADRLEELRSMATKAVDAQQSPDHGLAILANYGGILLNMLPAIISALRGRESVIEECARIADSYSRGDDDFAELASRIRSLSSTSQVIEGLVLVPMEPTEEMRSAFHSTANCVLDENGFAVPIWERQYRAMIKAAKGGE